MTYILHKKPPALQLQAGQLAQRLIQQDGLYAQHVDMLPGAAGGPKGLGLKGLDQAIFAQFLPRAKQRRALIGSSIGAWRFASILAWGVDQGSEKLAELYTHLEFDKGMTTADISRVCDEMLQQLIIGREQKIVTDPDFHLTVLAVKAQHIFRSDHAVPLLASAAGIIATNTLSRRLSGVFMQRVVAQPEHHLRLKLNTDKDFKTLYQTLSAENLYHWLMASGAIPGVMHGVRDIPHAPQGVYRDGGIIDYHLDLPYPSQGIVLYPHFGHKIIPSWFDKGLFWRKANPQHQARTLLICPSPSYLQSLPMQRLPDRKDFQYFIHEPQKRIKIWKQCIAESQRLGDEFLEMVEKQNFAELIQPL
jgi:hypothetical protein